jgi:N6-L-threonylcarbamoyladenine synthase
MKVLAIETSCDETGIALVEAKKVDGGFEFKTHKAMLLSQAALHAEYGGVYPNLAKREHEKNLPILYREFADLSCDAVAVTHGPGLEPALWQGVEFAKRAAAERGVPLLPVNHMEGHLISSLIQPNENHSNILQNVRMSVLALLISGGHTEFVHMKDWFDYGVIGQTLDDAVGEAYDKVARMLGLSYPGGPEISKHATRSRARAGVSAIKLPRPMLQSGTCDVSFSGLKTAALYSLRGVELTDEHKEDFAAEFEEAVGDVFVAKTRQALESTNAQTFVIGGGVAANTYLRERLQTLVADEFPDVEFRLPELSITGDNAVMIAQCALVRALSGKDDTADNTLRAVGNLSIARKN